MATYYGGKYKLMELKHLLKESVLSYKIAFKSKTLSKPQADKPLHIAIIDGTATHGGMCDRFKGIVTLYAYCKCRNLPFRIKYTYPFRLEDYLSPATYDWTLKENEYTDNPKYRKILYMRKEYLATRLLKSKTQKQIHFYGNRDSLSYINATYAKDFSWGELFRELFKPVPVLKERIQSAKQELGGEYYAAVFRFQNLLGDFKEYHYKQIGNKEEAEHLINKCLDAIRNLKTIHKDKAILVTSDSVTFLKRVSQLESVHTIPGALVHMDSYKKGSLNNDYEAHLKSFLDFYMLSEAKKIYRIGTSYMYPSEFPIYAAKIHDIPFESITI